MSADNAGEEAGLRRGSLGAFPLAVDVVCVHVVLENVSLVFFRPDAGRHGLRTGLKVIDDGVTGEGRNASTIKRCKDKRELASGLFT